MWIWFANCITYETRRRDSLPSEGTTREHPGAAVPIKFRQRASGVANCCTGRVDGIREDGRARGLVPSVSLVSSRARARVYGNPKIFRSGDIFWTYATDNRSRLYTRPDNLYRQPFEFSKRPTGRGILNNLPCDSSYKAREIRADFCIARTNRKG